MPLLVLISLVGLFFTIRLHGLQFRFFIAALRLSFSRRFKKTHNVQGDISPFQALTTSLAAAIGTGNIAGVATAIGVGGMGSLFWMWVMAFFGMIIKYAEAVLAVKYRIRNAQGEMSGGPMYYLSRGTSFKALAYFYAFLGIFACIGTGNLIQTHSVADALADMMGLNPWMSGILLAVATTVVLVGGVQRVGAFAEKVVPPMALFFLTYGLIILFTNSSKLLPLLEHIFQSAFTGQAAVGGFVGSTFWIAIQEGFARGVISNESGLGTSSIASAAAQSDYPARQGFIAMTSVFWSTFIVCSITGLCIGVSGLLGTVHPQTGQLLNGAPLAIKAFSTVWGGDYVVTIGLVLFAFTTIVGWAYYGEKLAEYLFGAKSIAWYRSVYIICIFLGAGLELEMVWTVSDITNALMAIPNLIGLIILYPVVFRETIEFISILREDKKHSIK